MPLPNSRNKTEALIILKYGIFCVKPCSIFGIFMLTETQRSTIPCGVIKYYIVIMIVHSSSNIVIFLIMCNVLVFDGNAFPFP